MPSRCRRDEGRPDSATRARRAASNKGLRFGGTHGALDQENLPPRTQANGRSGQLTTNSCAVAGSITTSASGSVPVSAEALLWAGAPGLELEALGDRRKSREELVELATDVGPFVRGEDGDGRVRRWCHGRDHSRWRCRRQRHGRRSDAEGSAFSLAERATRSRTSLPAACAGSPPRVPTARSPG